MDPLKTFQSEQGVLTLAHTIQQYRARERGDAASLSSALGSVLTWSRMLRALRNQFLKYSHFTGSTGKASALLPGAPGYTPASCSSACAFTPELEHALSFYTPSSYQLRPVDHQGSCHGPF